MARPLNLELEGNILDAAQELWSSAGEAGLTIRAVAQAAHTTPTTIYSRFADKVALMVGLRNRAEARMRDQLTKAKDVIDGFHLYLDFAREHPHDYLLLFGIGWRQRLDIDASRELMRLLQGDIATALNGPVEAYQMLALQCWIQLHGSAVLIITGGPDWPLAGLIRQTCIASCEAMMKQYVPMMPPKQAPHPEMDMDDVAG